MTPEELDRVERDAAEVINGFKTAKERQARDVLRLVAVLRLRDRQIAELQRRASNDPLGLFA